MVRLLEPWRYYAYILCLVTLGVMTLVDMPGLVRTFPDLFIWYYFLRLGLECVYQFAEAMTHHTGQIDSYYLGKWNGLGSCHPVQH